MESNQLDGIQNIYLLKRDFKVKFIAIELTLSMLYGDFVSVQRNMKFYQFSFILSLFLAVIR